MSLNVEHSHHHVEVPVLLFPTWMFEVVRGLAWIVTKLFLWYHNLVLNSQTKCLTWPTPDVMMAPSVYQNSKTSSSLTHKIQKPRFLVNGSANETQAAGSPDKSHCSSMSDGENFECYGEAGGDDLDSTIGEVGNRSPNGINRHSWTRTSLRRTPPSSGKRQLGSNALASHLYRSSSFNSSGCGSSGGEPGDDMYSDVSLEEDVQGLNYKVQMLQQQVTSLADTQNSTDDRYTRAKADNAVLQTRVHMLEEQLREIEVRCEDRMTEEQKRCRESIIRIERDRDSQIDTLNQRLNSAENEAGNMKQEVGRLRGIAEGLRVGSDAESRRLKDAQDSLADLTVELQQTKEAERRQREQNLSTSSLVKELQNEIERLKKEQTTAALPTTQPELLRLEELHEELNNLRQENKTWKETVEELQAQILTRGIEEGRSLLNGVGNLSNGHEHSLAAELEEMTNDQFDGCFTHITAETPLEQMQKALKEQQDVNNQLRTYIDGILLSIVENYPQLLEVKHKQNV